MSRRPVLPVLTILLLIGSVVPAFAARRGGHVRRIAKVTVQAEGHGSLIAVTYSGPRQHVRFLHTVAAIDRVALSDVDNDGEQDILASPHDGDLLLWLNVGHGRFVLGSPPRDARIVAERGPRFLRLRASDDGWQLGDERYDAAMPRAPAVEADLPIALVSFHAIPPALLLSIRSSSGRAPPSLS